MLGLFALPLFAGDHKQDGRCRDDHRTANGVQGSTHAAGVGNLGVGKIDVNYISCFVCIVRNVNYKSSSLQT